MFCRFVPILTAIFAIMTGGWGGGYGKFGGGYGPDYNYQQGDGYGYQGY